MIGVTRQNKVIMEYLAQELHTQAFLVLTEAEHLDVREDAEERHLSYDFL